MMSDFFLALLLALIQGLTEFLPVSSSAHLLFPSLLFGAKDFGIVFDISVHAGTLAAVIYYFKKVINFIVCNILDLKIFQLIDFWLDININMIYFF